MILTGEQIQYTARSTAGELLGVSSGRPFVDKLEVYKVAGKVFLIVTDDPGEPIVTVKCEPGHARALQRQHASIMPGRYLNKAHWISVGPGRGITRDLVADLVEQSYELVLDTVPHRGRPGRTLHETPGS